MAPTKKADSLRDVPIFLRKTYEMVNTCDPTIAGWSEDGETFVVKDPVKFEKVIIPQFFKHNKFSSFVRQLNFYSFRKIRYDDSVRIDPKAEKETKNFWRFRHPNFLRGRPDLLTEIKRMHSHKPASSSVATDGSKPAAVNPEVQALQKRIEEMNKNIDELSAMVQKVNLKQEAQEKAEQEANAGSKRKKMSAEPMEVASSSSTTVAETVLPDIRPDDMVSSMDLEEMAALPLPDPMPSAHRETSVMTQVSDNEFVEQLFTAFGEESTEDALEFDDDLRIGATADLDVGGVEPDNRPDPELMQRLSDALMVLPREIQEMIVERLIKAITSPDFVEKNTPSVSSPSAPVPVPQTEEEITSTAAATPSPEAALPLAAATLAALLHQYSTKVQQQEGGKKVKAALSKTLPVIPVHA